MGYPRRRPCKPSGCRGAGLLGQQTVGAVRVPLEVRGVATRVALTMLRQEDLVGVVCPARAGATKIAGAEALTEQAVGASLSDVLNEAAHAAKYRCACPATVVGR